ncbi:hypothetical protein CDV55_104136 [Aspergillus turcosus]|uniref:Uncharacterized protein n=1 Tax=Aspergillus turcosus TaxID=1245748 RepID=A0A229X4H3_9EURO|nr:hypothetical protein CDV55_104136 [Aspergillus turcosus]RLL95197.1 hypothetical protein CFD26_104461 [Aspergillus turcosus]
MAPIRSLWLDAYLAWINAWLSNPRSDTCDEDFVMSLGEMTSFFHEKNLLQLLDSQTLRQIVISFRRNVDSKKVLLGGKVPPSCDETNIITHRYDPRSNCTCSGLYPVPPGATFESVLKQNKCTAVKRMVDMAKLANEREDEWNPRHLFTAEQLNGAVVEFVLSNADEQAPPDTCLGPMPSLANIRAPDRRPDPGCDTEPSVYHQLYPTNEQIKLLTDAKYFFAIACGGGICDEGLAKAVAEAANNVLIADYCEAADEKSLFLLQDVGAAAMAFLKLCNLAGVITDWQFDNNVALAMQFCILGYYRDHSTSRRPSGVYGSRMTGILSHRYIDLAIYVGVVNASIGTGKEISREQYTLLAEACCYINDLIDFRSDAMRKLRENVILRGIRGNLCKYLDGLISSCLRTAAKAIRSSPVSALVVMGISNWMLMASQHKVYEVFYGVQAQKDSAMCEYASESDGSYQELLEALAGFHTLGEHGPSVRKRRADMDLLYHAQRTSPQKHMAWLADSTRSLLHPSNLRKIIDVVHFEWSGQTGDVGYCP